MPLPPKIERAPPEHPRTHLAASIALAAIWVMLCVRVGPPHGDFANYYTAAALWLEGTPLGDIYDYSWFTEQAWRLGFSEQPVGFAVLTPPSALLAVPLVWLGPQGAATAWWVGQCGLGVAIAYTTARLINRPLWVGFAGLLAAWPALQSHLSQGQMHLPVLLCVVAGMWAWLRQRDVMAGVLFALAVGLKVHAWPLVLLAVLVGRWRAALASLATLGVGAAVSIAALGWPIHAVFLSEIAPAAAAGWYVDPWHISLQSFGHLARHLWVPHPALNPHAVCNHPWLAQAMASGVLWCGVALTAARAGSWRALDKDDRARLLACASFVALVGGSILARYHLVLAVPGVLLGCSALLNKGRIGLGLTAALCAAAAAWTPIPEVWPSGVWALLAIPRCWFLVGAWALIFPWQPRWRAPWLAGALGLAALLSAVSTARAPSPNEHSTLDGVGYPLIITDLRLDGGHTLGFAGLGMEGWREYSVDLRTRVLTRGGGIAGRDGLWGHHGQDRVSDDRGRVYWLCDDGVGVMATRICVVNE